MASETITRKQLRDRRRDLGLSQDAVVAALGRGNAGALSRWEHHARGVSLGGLTEAEYDKLLTKLEKKRGRS
jgi:transcriptional regulator with XRE-family HTH domain